MDRLRVIAAAAVGAVAAATLAACAPTGDGDDLVVRHSAEYVVVSGDAARSADTTGTDPIRVEIHGRTWEVIDIVFVDPTLHSTLVTAQVRDPATGEHDTLAFDTDALRLVAP